MEALLIEKAKQAIERSYSPYSHFRVGAALLCDDLTIVLGTNVENASYGLTICAERSAICAAVALGKRVFTKLVLVADTEDFCYPCGACCQCLAEFAPTIPIVLATLKGHCKTIRLNEIFLIPFDLKTHQSGKKK